jgi:ribonuclease-3 family protein
MGESMEREVLGANLPSVGAMAYIGDSRHSLYVRKMLVKRGIAKSGELNSIALGYVTAEAQAAAYEKIKRHLTEMESDTFRRAFNSSHLNKPKRASSKDYRCATGFEAIIGMLEFLGDQERIEALMKIAYEEGDYKDDSEN